MQAKIVEVRDSLFDIRRAKVLVLAGYAQTENAIFSNVKFLTNEVGGGHYVGAKNLIVENCRFIHSGTTPNYSRMMASESMRVENSIFKNQSFRFDGGNIYGTEILAKDTGYVTHSFKNNQIIWDAPYGLAVHEARGPGVSFVYIPRLDDYRTIILKLMERWTSLGSQHTLRVFTEGF